MQFIVGVLAFNLMLSSVWAQEEGTKVNLAGSIRTAMHFAIEVPLNNLSVNTASMGKTYFDAGRYIISTKGIKGFYSGSSIELLRSAMWYPRMCLLQKGADNTHSAAAGVTALEALAMPLYRMRTAMMVEQLSTVQRQVPHILRTLYAGTLLRALPAFLSWDAFLLTQDYSKEHLRGSPLRGMALTTGTQMGMAVAMAPIYVVLINRQKLTETCNLPFWPALKHHYSKHGVGIYARTAFLGATLLGVQSVLTVGAMQFSCAF